MNKPRETTKPITPDAPFPNMTENNQKYYGLNGWDRVKNNMEFNVNTANNQQRNAMDISYDGDYLTANAYKISPQGDTINQQTFRKKAYSGRSQDGKFDYSLENQATRDIGPLPEGNYYINPQNIQRYNPSLIENAVDHIGGALGQIYPRLKVGNRPGGTTS
ncbi:MAG: hypothetical protein R3Y04_04980 [Rikenellaceae bacterium]